MHGHAHGFPFRPPLPPGGAAPPPWSPDDSTPLDVLDAGDQGAIYTTTGKTILSSYLQAPVGAVVPTIGPAGDWLQSTTARRMTLVVLGDQMSFLADGTDDNLGRVNNYASASAKTVGIRAQYTVAIGAGDTDVLLTVGGASRGFKVQIGGASSAHPGISFAADMSGPTVSRRCSTWIPTTTAFTLVVVYKGGGNTTTANYALFVDGVELTIDTTGPSLSPDSTSYVLNAGAAASPIVGKFSRFCVVAEDKSASHGDVEGWLEEPMTLLSWTPQSPGDPAWWHEVVLGRIWQDTAGTVAATTAGDPIARIDARFGTNFTQASVSLQPYLSTLGDGLAARSDDVDDNLGNTATKSAGAGVLAVIFEIFSAPSSSGNETILRLGATPVQVILRHSGLSASSAKGWHVGFDRTSSSAACIQGTSPELLSVGVHTLVVRYDGVSAIAASSYRIWLDGVEVTTAAGGNVAASGNTRWLATSIATEVANAAVRESILWTSALAEAECIAAAAYLEAKR